MTAPTTNAPPPSERSGCGFQIFGLLLTLVLIWLGQRQAWWPRECGWGTGLAYVGTGLVALVLSVALAGLWDKIGPGRRR